MLLMDFHEGQTVALIADAQISETAFIASGTYGYVDQISNKSISKLLQATGGEDCSLKFLVHFPANGLKAWIPEAIIEPADGS